MSTPLTYTWSITSIKTKTEGTNVNAVVQTYWKKTGKDSADHEGTFSGATPFTTTTMPAGAVFVPFDQLTEEIVLGWVKAVVVGGYEEHVNAQIAKQIDEKINTVTEAKMPWAPETPVETPPVTSA